MSDPISKCTDCVVFRKSDGTWMIQAWFDNGREYIVPIDQYIDRSKEVSDERTSERTTTTGS
jgi:hypothetical protein